MLKIIIVEDEPLIAFDLAHIVEERTGARVVIAVSVYDAMNDLDESSFVFLDMNVVDGKTFDFARLLIERGIPFTFASGSRRSDLPCDLLSAPFIVKPFTSADIDRALTERLADSTARPEHA